MCLLKLGGDEGRWWRLHAIACEQSFYVVLERGLAGWDRPVWIRQEEFATRAPPFATRWQT